MEMWEQEVGTALNRNWERLGRAVVGRAVLDLVVARHPGTCKKQLQEWRARMSPGNTWPLEAWARVQRDLIVHWLAHGGEDLAVAVGSLHLLRMVQYGHVDRRRLKREMNAARPMRRARNGR